MTNQKIIQQGAEATIKLKDSHIIKQRIKKAYRIQEIDEKIRKLRTRSEAKLLEKASKIIPTPKIINVNENQKEIIMEFIQGKKLSEDLDLFPEKQKQEVFKLIGENISKLHNSNIIHGDLTTSNMIYQNDLIYLIDFGLAFQSHRIEDKAVDLHLLKQALEAKHFSHWEKSWKTIENSYKKNSINGKEILERLKTVESRGRYKDKY